MKNKLIIALLFATSFIASHTLTAKNDSAAVNKNDAELALPPTHMPIKNGIGLTFTPMLSMPVTNYGGIIKPAFTSAAGISGNLVISKKHKMFIGVELGYFGNATYFKNNNYYAYTSRYNYACVAVSLQKVIAKVCRNVYLFGGIGAQLNYNYSVGEKIKTITGTNGKTFDDYNLSPYSIQQKYSASAFAKVGLMAKLSKHISFFAAPVFYYGLNPNVAFKQNYLGFNNVGLNLQLIYCF